MDGVARGRGARGRGGRVGGRGDGPAARGGRAAPRGGRGVARGGRVGGRGGRGRGRGEQAESDGSAAPSVHTASVTQSVPLAGDASVSAGVGAGAGAVPVGGAAPAPGLGDQFMGILTQILARLPQAAPEQAPGVPPVAGAQQGAGFVGQQQAAGFVEQQGAAGFVQPGAAFVGQHGVAALGHPSYLEMMREMQRIGTPFFEGGIGPEQADEWRSRVERNFQSIRCPVEYQVEIAIHYLSGDAHLWWRAIAGRRAVWTWGDFVEEFDSQYFPQEARDRFQMRFLALTQGDRSVRDYAAEFSRLVVHAGFGIGGERMILGRLLQGLRPSIRQQCRTREFVSRAELVELAASIEEDQREQVGSAVVPVAAAPATQPKEEQQQQRPQQHRRGSSYSSGASRGFRPAQGQKRSREETSGVSRFQRGTCYGCGSTEHRVYNCPKKDTLRDTRVCYHCREPGHVRPMCPKLQSLTVAAVQPVAARPVSQIAAVQTAGQSGSAPRGYSSVETGQTSQAGSITGILIDSDFVNYLMFYRCCYLLR